MENAVSFYAKLMLFGEYSLLLGSSALAIPVRNFSAKTAYYNKLSGMQHATAEKSNQQLLQLYQYFNKQPEIFSAFLDLDYFRDELRKGFYIDSDIPQRSGLGSSGSVCAVIYKMFSTCRNEQDLTVLRERFSLMENFFHGRSSGFDPLVIYLGKNILLDGFGHIHIAPELLLPDKKPFGVQLIDSGMPRSEIPYVPKFMEQFAPSGKAGIKAEKLIQFTDACINSLLANETDAFWKHITELSAFQMNEMKYLVPEHLQPVWKMGLDSGDYAIKLCGSGGGGYFICFSKNKSIVHSVAWGPGVSNIKLIN